MIGNVRLGYIISGLGSGPQGLDIGENYCENTSLLGWKRVKLINRLLPFPLKTLAV